MAVKTIRWSAAHELGVVPMDDTHREFVEIYNAVATAGDGSFLARLDALLAHTDAHFAQENVWMAESGFPPTAIHKGEHERVLAALRQVRRRVAEGDIAAGRDAIAQVPDWFDQHAATMDAALANWMSRVGYQPVAAEAAG
jgi:hemerythrin-like metal-binding protein